MSETDGHDRRQRRRPALRGRALREHDSAETNAPSTSLRPRGRCCAPTTWSRGTCPASTSSTVPTSTATEHELVGIIGPNGAGKSTLLKALFGLVKIGGGTVPLGDEDITNKRADHLVAKGIGFVPADQQRLPEPHHPGEPRDGRRTRRRSVQEAVRLRRRAVPRPARPPHQRAGSLSGGERQMVAMGRALMMEPSVLLLDEPSAGLSPVLQDEVFVQTRAHQRAGVSVVMVEQNARRCLQICDRGYVLDQGRNAYTASGTRPDQRPQGDRALPRHAGRQQRLTEASAPPARISRRRRHAMFLRAIAQPRLPRTPKGPDLVVGPLPAVLRAQMTPAVYLKLLYVLSGVLEDTDGRLGRATGLAELDRAGQTVVVDVLAVLGQLRALLERRARGAALGLLMISERSRRVIRLRGDRRKGGEHRCVVRLRTVGEVLQLRVSRPAGASGSPR